MTVPHQWYYTHRVAFTRIHGDGPLKGLESPGQLILCTSLEKATEWAERLRRQPKKFKDVRIEATGSGRPK